MKSYNSLTTSEKLALSSEQFYSSVLVEAATRGLELPITLSDAITKSNFRGYQPPPDAVTVYELVIADEYHNIKGTGLAYRTEAQATKLLAGAVHLYEEGWGDKARTRIKEAEVSLRAVQVSLTKPSSISVKLHEVCTEPSEEFTTLLESCRSDLELLTNEAYNRRVSLERRAQYLKLASGDESIAARFWEATYHSPFPSAPTPEESVTP